MLTQESKDWFSNVQNLVAVVIFLVMGLMGQSKETILALLIYMFAGLVAKFGPGLSLIIGMVLSIPGANLFL